MLTTAGRAFAKGGQVRANLSAKELSAGASTAAKARWEQHDRAHPEKLKARKEREAKKKRVGK
jgi:hypothetical protein